MERINVEELYFDPDKAEPVMTEFKTKTPQYFILDRNGKLYLVDTSGYDYIRYGCKLEM